MYIVRKEGHLFIGWDFAAILFKKQKPREFHVD